MIRLVVPVISSCSSICLHKAHHVLPDVGSRFGRNAPHLTDDPAWRDQLQRRAAFHPAAKFSLRWKFRFVVS